MYPFSYVRPASVQEAVDCLSRFPDARPLAGGMTLMRDDGERLVAAGITSPEEVLRVTRD